ncbi:MULTISPECIES: hypothetical protein [unclassified Mesorhizobium]|uniref:hypothetical protein n=1 Tax=unclassified Mesorhizobium TaxID=325217 RepID=UPI00333C783F
MRQRFYDLAGSRFRAGCQRGGEKDRRALQDGDAIRGRSADERLGIRQEKSTPIIAALDPWLREKLGLISQKDQARRGDPLHALALGRPLALSRDGA